MYGCGSSGGNTGGSLTDVLYLNDGTGKFTDSGQWLGSSTGRSVRLADLDDDGDLDALVVNGITLSAQVQGAAGQPNVLWWNKDAGPSGLTHVQ
jgi:hypothetical protein